MAYVVERSQFILFKKFSSENCGEKLIQGHRKTLVCKRFNGTLNEKLAANIILAIHEVL